MDRTLHLENLPRTIELERDGDGRARLAYIDQRRLPDELVYERTGDWCAVVDAVKSLAVRGAPALGIAGAAAVALWAGNEGASRAVARGCAGAGEFFLEELEPVAAEVAAARPTAVNLAWGVRRAAGLARGLVASGAAPGEAADALFDEVKRMEAEDEAVNRAIGACGAELLAPGSRILTHCNAGSLGTAFYGTALGIVYAAAAQGKVERVFADETRPVGQGARLTAWELSRAGVPCTLICDDMAASLMAAGGVDAVLVGADRIAANGDVANKIGTYGVAVLARHHGIPFYVAAPTSTIDLSLQSGGQIPIEERDPREVLPRPIAGVDVWNPAFDVTPAALVDRVVTERGAFAPGELGQALSSVRA
ncbi:S-methyl-5-thioribose-1-phosphate isomerase [Gordonibacter sp. 28C]|uniref:S-methyl-5-thioribose-1-phosphate isomerase n=1 Tax=Gordonibacter sp. 28C TaxID=2078569 RepID=UPI000DF865C5|nr:S-methyl-5-thioribose-1-phosphate isomerase [Gordonibacter sp. 28C]RDB61737.1 S-methyl-5-thioribose-1-phosphate isomerase [Gordonibacter sp. 28C]